jgi:hypothetical protein
MLKTPWLIQRCELKDGKLGYDYMGSTEFEVGDQATSLKRIFAKEIAINTAPVNINGRNVMVYMIAGHDFQFADYQPYLQQLAEHKLRLQERTNFDDMVKVQAGFPISRVSSSKTNAWFDFKNDVLWVLEEEDQKALISVLEGIKKKWSEKK